MKIAERERARALRKQGMSINDIVVSTKASKASVSLWVRDIVLTQYQRHKLNARGFSVEAIEKRRTNRIENTRKRHREVIESAKARISKLSKDELLLVGTALYWGEGAKAMKGMARLTNSDPDLIRMAMRYFREILEVPPEKFRGHIHTFSHINVKKAEKYWSDVSGIPLKQFYKTYSKPSVAGKGKRDSLPYGTLEIGVCDTTKFLTIKGWIERLSEMGSA